MVMKPGSGGSSPHLAQLINSTVALRFRRKRLVPLIEMIEVVHREKGSVRIIDIGGTSAFWRLVPNNLLDRCNMSVWIVNLPGVEVPRVESRFRFEDGNGCELKNYKNHEFDIVFSNSVIEHVGGWRQMRLFAEEVRRLAPRYFVQTPNFWFPVEPHCMTPFFHWLPFATRVWLLLHLDLGAWRGRRTVDAAVHTAESARLLNAKMMRELFPDAKLHKERLLMLPKSLMAIKR